MWQLVLISVIDIVQNLIDVAQLVIAYMDGLNSDWLTDMDSFMFENISESSSNSSGFAKRSLEKLFALCVTAILLDIFVVIQCRMHARKKPLSEPKSSSEKDQ